MTDTGQVPGEGLPQDAGTVGRPGVPAPGAHTFHEPSGPTAEDDDLLLMPGAQGAWTEDRPAPAPEGYAAPAGAQLTDGAGFVVGAPGVYDNGVQGVPHAGHPMAQEAGHPVAHEGGLHVAHEAGQLGQAGQVGGQVGGHDGSTYEGAYDGSLLGAHDGGLPGAHDAAQFGLHDAAQQGLPDAGLQAAHDSGHHDAGYNDAGHHDSGHHAVGPALHIAPDAALHAAPEGVAVPAQDLSVPGAPEAAAHDSGAMNGAQVQGGKDAPIRRPLHMGPPTPGAPTTSPVRSLADRGPAGTPANPVQMRRSGPPTTGPEYLDVPQEAAAAASGAHPDAELPGPHLGEIPSQAAAPWPQAPQAQSAETVVPQGRPVGATPATPDVEAFRAAQAAAGFQAVPQGAELLGVPEPAHAGAPAAHGAALHAGQGPAHGPALAVDGAAQAYAAHPGEPVQGPAEPVHGAAGPQLHVGPQLHLGAVQSAADAMQAAGAVHPAAPAQAGVSAGAVLSGGEQHTPAAPVPMPAAPSDEHAGADAGTPVTAALTPQDQGPIGEFVPVDGVVPSTPHLAPTPPHALRLPEEPVVPAEEQQPVARTEEQAAPVEEPQAPAAEAPAEDVQPQAAAPHAETPQAENPQAPEPEQEAAVEVPAPRDGEPVEAQQAIEAQQTAEADVEQDQDAPDAQQPEAAAQPTDPATAPEPNAAAVQATEQPAEQPAEEPALATEPEPALQAEHPAPGDAQEEGPELLHFPAELDDPENVDIPEQPEAPALHEAAEAPAAPGETDETDGTFEGQEAPEAHEGPAAPGYADAEREAVLRVMRERRDIRNGFRSDPIPHEVLLRVLEAAHTAPSVGHSQPWDFVVIRSADTRRTMHELAMRQRDAYAKSLPKGRAKQFKELKIEAILETPVNIVVTADPTRGGRHTLGRHTQPQMAPYSSALAVENLWLAARAEGLGVGWVSFFDEREMVRTLGLPEHLEVVAYLCVGYVDEFPAEPELMQAGWSKRRPLSWVVHEETYGRRALPGEDPHDLLAETVSNIRPLDAKALGEAWERQKRMTKPAGALGMLEIISAQLSGLSRMCPPPIPEPAAVAIFAGDHGVHAQGVTPWPQEVTGQMVANFLGGGAVCNAFANQVGAEVCVIDVGVASDLPATPGLLPRKVRAGTADMTTGPALTREEVKAAIEVGIETARDLVAAGNKALLTGEMGIANTTASAALISVFTDADPAEVTGRGTGINDETLARKTDVVRRALELHQPDPADPIGVLAAIGGLEHAAIVGLLLGGASLRTPVILDGVSAGAAALVARAIAPEVLAACIAGHRSAEPGHVAALNKLGLRPLVDLDLRLGEGTGALLALPVVQSAARAMHEVATFDSAGVTEK
ncbi:nicotinate-nucleotide--dimethylbenzimidazole phosphoribosyltransferase [Streptomyces sp. NPDC050418]|uniref:nicotinate-nucleotide--dimethylbenzimidazole phosphoribosyltransferase n=1 Tax=Streptomyces sp. NPDC050418 TaxID=3365612 RepID=UPI00379D1739